MLRYLLLASLGLTTACSATQAQNPCDDIGTILNASGESVPFESLITEPAKFESGAIIANSWLTRAELFGKSCKLGTIKPFGGDSPNIQILTCELESGMLKEEEAKAAFENAASQFKSCLEEEWSTPESSSNGPDDQNLMFERAADKARQADFTMYAYPIQVKYSNKPQKRNGRASGPATPKAEVVFQFHRAASESEE